MMTGNDENTQIIDLSKVKQEHIEIKRETEFDDDTSQGIQLNVEMTETISVLKPPVFTDAKNEENSDHETSEKPNIKTIEITIEHFYKQNNEFDIGMKINKEIKQEYIEIKPENKAYEEHLPYMIEKSKVTSNIIEADSDTNIGMTLKAEVKDNLSSTVSLLKEETSVTKKLTTKDWKPYSIACSSSNDGTKNDFKKQTKAKERPYACSYCDARFARKYHLNVHVKRHTGEGLLYCPHCSYKSTHKSNYNIHLKKHTGDGMFHCQHCSYKSAYKGHLESHLKVHSGEKAYTCSYCKYKSNFKKDINNHIKKHTGEGLFHCHNCDYKSANKDNLIIHMKKHTGKGLFYCHHCSYKSVYKKSLENHLKTHTSDKAYACKYCEYKCNFKESLNNHTKKHTGQNLFYCQQCDYKSTTKGTFDRHLKTHTGEKLYSCNYCEYKCIQKVHLNNHYLKKHTGESLR